MLQEQKQKIFTSDCSCFPFPGLRVDIGKGNVLVIAADDLLFLNNPFVEISTKIDQRLVAVPHVFTVNHPFTWTITRHPETAFHNALKQFCPENFCQCLVAEDIITPHSAPQTFFCINACSRHNHMDMGMEIQPP